MLDWLRAAHETSTWTTSVCTGSLVLGAAGVLEGKRATSHWAYRDELRTYGAEPVAERVVVDGKVVTAAGVSSGIDMALQLAALIAGDDVAQAIQLGIEYDPDAAVRLRLAREGGPELVELIRGLEGEQIVRRGSGPGLGNRRQRARGRGLPDHRVARARRSSCRPGPRQASAVRGLKIDRR